MVSRRGIPPDQVADAVRISSRYPAVHGAPVHIGDPAALCIDCVDDPDYGYPPVLEPGYMLITDAADGDYLVP